MTDVYLLEGPDGNTYKAILGYCDFWSVSPFTSFGEPSEWWKKQSTRIYWMWNIEYTSDELKNTFKILATRTTTDYD